jgi:hypothetical protein
VPKQQQKLKNSWKLTRLPQQSADELMDLCRDLAPHHAKRAKRKYNKLRIELNDMIERYWKPLGLRSGE